MDLPLINQSVFYEIWPLPAAVTHDGDAEFCGGCAAEVCSDRNPYASTTVSTVTYQSGRNGRDVDSEGESWKKLTSAGNGWDQEEGGGGEEVTPKQEFIHVRARRGQATDSHSLAERVRREKISERMRILQGLVPGCSRVTGKALILDEIINYIQSLEHQIQLLSMKLEAFDNNSKGVERWSNW